MDTIEKRAKLDQSSKLRHERKLSQKLKAIFRRIVRDFKKNYSSSQKVITALDYEADFQAVMMERLVIVTREFKRSFRRFQSKDDTDSTNDNELLLWLLFYVKQQNSFISETTDGQIAQIMNDTMADMSARGLPITKEIVAQKVSEKFIKQSMARAELIACEVVNTVAEKSKHTEAVILVTLGIMQGKKMWHTNLDGRERPTHHSASGQIKSINVPFNVGGSLMQYPKDRSLGAENKEIFRCRCSAIHF